MSVKFGGIDLNLEVDSFEANSEVGLDKSSVLTENHSDPCDGGGVSVDGAGVLGEVNNGLKVSGLVSEGLDAEMNDVDRYKNFKPEIEIENGEVKKENSMNEGGVVDCDLGVEVKRVDNGEIVGKIETDINKGVGIGAFLRHPQDGDKISLVVDLNAHHGADVEVISNHGIDNSGTEIKEGLKLRFPFELVENAAASSKEPNRNGNEDMSSKDKLTNEDADKMGVKCSALIPKSRGRENQTEKEGEFYASDLIWGKVRSHPWWPGQIFEPSAASDKAMKYFKKDSYLIAYFGDQTFAWNEPLKIKPFRMYFSQMEKQSNAEAFSRAVDGALVEVSRRVETELACRCLPDEVSAKVKSQIVVNAGIQKQSSIMHGGDSFLTATSFNPEVLVNYLKSLAGGPNTAINRLEFTTVRAQLLAFSRWKGFYQLPVFEELGGILVNDTDAPLLLEEKIAYEVLEDVSGPSEDDKGPGKARSATEDSSRKRKHPTSDIQCKKKKKKRLMVLMSGSSSSLPDGKKKYKEKTRRKINSVSYGEKHKAVEAVSSQMVRNTTSSLTRKYAEVGECIRAVAGKLGGSTNSPGSRFPASSTGKSHRGRMTPWEYPPTNELLSTLIIGAENPVDNYTSLTSVASFFSYFRKSICLEYNHLQKEEFTSRKQKPEKSSGEQKPEKSSGEQKPEKSSELETTEAFKFEGMEDSYWTDRIIQSSLDEQVLFEPQTLDEKNILVAEPEGIDETNQNKDNNRGSNTIVNDLEMENPSCVVDEKSNEYCPTALILNFSDLESVPSIPNLNNIFNHYGPVIESETEVLSKSKRAKVVFKRRSDAETAFSSTGKFRIFGPSLVSYRLKYLPKARRVLSASTTKRRKNATSAEEAAM